MYVLPLFSVTVARYLMPWELPQEHVDKAWRLLGRKTLRWETRLEGGIRMALDEVPFAFCCFTRTALVWFGVCGV